MGNSSMTVVFKGIKQETHSRGCGCRRRRRSGTRMATIKPFHLPSGTTVVFRVGQRQKVADSDGEFLLREFPTSFEMA